MSTSSQNSTDTHAVSARQPKRARGHQRVEALLDAAATVFIERGIEAATMTAIAARAGASIGSLYQFFPHKAALAEALNERFMVRALAVFEALAEAAPRHTPDSLADALIGYMHTIEHDRAASLTLIDVRNEHDVKRVRNRTILCQALARALCAAAPDLDTSRAMHCARLLLYMLRLVTELPNEADGRGLAEELRALLKMYLGGLGVQDAA